MIRKNILTISYKQQIAKNFSQAISTYNTYAVVQQECARELVKLLRSRSTLLPSGPILEIGCGTGLVTQELVKEFSDRSLVITDISQDMLNYCQQNLQLTSDQLQHIFFKQMDGEAIDIPVDTSADTFIDTSGMTYAAIVSGFVVQWFERPIESLKQLLSHLQPGGVLLASFPTHQSFPEWKQICETVGLPFTATSLPDPQDWSKQLTTDLVKCSYLEKQVATTYSQAIEFFKSLKLIGAVATQAQQTLSAAQMRKLIRDWDEQYPDGIQVHYHIAFLVICKEVGF